MADSAQSKKPEARSQGAGTEVEKRSMREPEGPAHPRKGGIFQTLKRTISEFKEDNLTDWAALTYYSVLSIFPALIALVSIVGLVGDPKTITKALTDIVSSIGPPRRSRPSRVRSRGSRKARAPPASS
jgi:membrane protein